MKVLSFSAVEILPALLDKSKTQTIRPAWKDKHPQWDKEPSKCIKEIREGFETKPRFQPKEQVTLMWKQRTSPKGSQFCSICGNRSALHSPDTEETGCCQGRLFPKILGIVEIESVFQIEMGKNHIIMPEGDTEINLAKRDSGGLWTPQDMFNWFDRKYHLGEPTIIGKIRRKIFKTQYGPKRFWVYRFKREGKR